MIVQFIMGLLAGSLLWLDRVYLFQFMLSRPMIMGPVIALIMGDLKMGILIGASLELLWLNAPPVGSYLPNDESFCTAVAVPVAFLAVSHMDYIAASGLSVLVCLPAAHAGRALDTKLRTMNENLIPPGEQDLERCLSGAIRKATLRAFYMAFMSISVSVGILGTMTHFLVPFIPDRIISAFRYMPFVFVIIGLSALVSKEVPSTRHAGVFIIGMIVVLLITWIL